MRVTYASAAPLPNGEFPEQETPPVIASAVIIGFSVQYSSPMAYIIGMGIPLLFVFLYAGQLKYLK